MIRLSVMVLTLVLATNQANGQSQAQEGAIAGGIAGAIIGGIAGHQNRETPEGIAIGGAVGAIAGGILGRAKDDQMIRNYQYQQQKTQQYNQRLQAAVSVNDAISLTRSGVGDALIVNQIRSNGVREKIGVNEIITMHQSGVSENVINTMQQTQQAGPVTTRQIQPVVVENRSMVIEHRPIMFEYPIVVGHGPTNYHPRPSMVLERHGNHYDARPLRNPHPSVRHNHW